MNLIVITPDHTVFEGAIQSVNVPGTSGGFEVKNNHAPLVSSLGEGQVTITQEGGEEKSFAIKDGFIEVLNNEISLLVTGVTE